MSLFCIILLFYGFLLEQDVDWNEICLCNKPSQPHVARKHCWCWYWTHFFTRSSSSSHNQKSVKWTVVICCNARHQSLWDKSRVSASPDTTGTFTNTFSANSWPGYLANDTMKFSPWMVSNLFQQRPWKVRKSVHARTLLLTSENITYYLLYPPSTENCTPSEIWLG